MVISTEPWKVDADEGEDDCCNGCMGQDQPVDICLHLIVMYCYKLMIVLCIHLLCLVNLYAAHRQTHQVGNSNLNKKKNM